MRAIVLAEQGSSPSLTELPTPEPGPGEVLVRVVSSSLNGFDTAVAAGWPARWAWARTSTRRRPR